MRCYENCSGSKLLIWRYVEVKRRMPGSICCSLLVGVFKYSDKSQMSLSATSYTLYPQHSTLLNFTKCMRRKHIVSWSTIVAYLLVSSCESKSEISWTRNRGQINKSLHFCINHIIKSLVPSALERHLYYTSVGREVPHCIVVATYVAVISESEILFSVKKGNQTAMPSHLCDAKRENHSCYSSAQKEIGLRQSYYLM